MLEGCLAAFIAISSLTTVNIQAIEGWRRPDQYESKRDGENVCYLRIRGNTWSTAKMGCDEIERLYVEATRRCGVAGSRDSVTRSGGQEDGPKRDAP